MQVSPMRAVESPLSRSRWACQDRAELHSIRCLLRPWPARSPSNQPSPKQLPNPSVLWGKVLCHSSSERLEFFYQADFRDQITQKCPVRLRLFTCPRSQLYHMASVRLRDLCAKLDISAELRRKIWTCFEYSLVHCTDLMMDRHLDQLLMCAVYIMSKVCVGIIGVFGIAWGKWGLFFCCQVTKEDRSFQNIMKCYRTQPQAGSNVRSVNITQKLRYDHIVILTSPPHILLSLVNFTQE